MMWICRYLLNKRWFARCWLSQNLFICAKIAQAQAN